MQGTLSRILIAVVMITALAACASVPQVSISSPSVPEEPWIGPVRPSPVPDTMAGRELPEPDALPVVHFAPPQAEDLASEPGRALALPAVHTPKIHLAVVHPPQKPEPTPLYVASKPTPKVLTLPQPPAKRSSTRPRVRAKPGPPTVAPLAPDLPLAGSRSRVAEPALPPALDRGTPNPSFEASNAKQSRQPSDDPPARAAAAPQARAASVTPVPVAKAPPTVEDAGRPQPDPEPEDSRRSKTAFQATAPPQASEAPMEELRLVYAKPGDQVSVHLDRQGWVYLGEDRRRSGVNYVSRHILDGSTQFVFEAEELGDYILRFQYQDLSEGVLREEGIRLSVVQEDAFRRAVASGTQESSEPRTSPLTRARNLAAEGRHAEAVELSESAVGRLSPEDMHRLAELYHGLGRIEPAVRLWRENLEADGEWSQRAAAGILAAAPAANDRQAFQDALDASPDAYLRIPPKDLVLASEKASAWGLVSQAIRMLEHALASQRGFDTDDEAYYLLARLYEQDTPLRNARKALELYTVIVEDMRRSRRWEAARERKLYLERHFFHVR